MILCEWAPKLPQSSLFLEVPQPGMIQPGHPGGVNWSGKFQKYDMDSRSSQSLLICAIQTKLII